MSPMAQYLSLYAETEVNELTGFAGQYEHCVCIPAYNEAPAFIYRTLEFLACQPGTLAIIVLNRPVSASSQQLGGEQVNCENTACKQVLEQQATSVWQSKHLQLFSLQADPATKQSANNSAVLLVDRFDKGEAIAVKQGVGLARKIATDIALKLISQKIITSPWIYSTDADVTLPDNYFVLAESNTDSSLQNTPASGQVISAYVLAYQHVASGDEAIDQATQHYEKRLRAYVDGLAYAGSDYAFHTIGSTLCVHAEHYARVRGMPKRAAGEDFYLLNKLRKTGLVVELTQPVVQITSRISHRTAFGTGTAVDDMLTSIEHQNTSIQDTAIFYHPYLFVMLREILAWMENLADQLAVSKQLSGSGLIDWQLYLNNPHTVNKLLTQDQSNTVTHLKIHRPMMIQALLAIDFESGLKHCLNNSKNSNHFKRHMYQWLDAFKTLKLLHALRDIKDPANNGKPYGNLSLKEYQAVVKTISEYPDTH